MRSWRQVRELERVSDGDLDGSGRTYRTVVRAVLPYRLRWRMVLLDPGAHGPDTLDPGAAGPASAGSTSPDAELVDARTAPSTLVWESRGDLDGRAEIRLDDLDVSGHAPNRRPFATRATIRWQVTPTVAWMRRLWPVAGRVLIRNHDAVMRRGIARLAEHLEAEVVEVHTQHRVRSPRRGRVGHRGGRSSAAPGTRGWSRVGGVLRGRVRGAPVDRREPRTGGSRRRGAPARRS